MINSAFLNALVPKGIKETIATEKKKIGESGELSSLIGFSPASIIGGNPMIIAKLCWEG